MRSNKQRREDNYKYTVKFGIWLVIMFVLVGIATLITGGTPA